MDIECLAYAMTYKKTLQFSTNPDLRLEPLQLAIHPCFKFKPQLSERLTTSYKTLVKKLQRKHEMDPPYEKNSKS